MSVEIKVKIPDMELLLNRFCSEILTKVLLKMKRSKHANRYEPGAGSPRK
jgi:hypothetical protein